MKEIIKRSIMEHRAALDAGEYTSVELTKAYLEAIDRFQPFRIYLHRIRCGHKPSKD